MKQLVNYQSNDQMINFNVINIRLIKAINYYVSIMTFCLTWLQVTPEYLQDICMRLFASSAGESLDVSKPGTVSLFYFIFKIYSFISRYISLWPTCNSQSPAQQIGQQHSPISSTIYWDAINKHPFQGERGEEILILTQ